MPKKTEIKWRVPGTEDPPTPRQGEVVVFVDHIGRGFKPPRSKHLQTLCAGLSERNPRIVLQLVLLVRSFMENGLTGVDFVRYWISWSILPLSRRPGLAKCLCNKTKFGSIPLGGYDVWRGRNY